MLHPLPKALISPSTAASPSLLPYPLDLLCVPPNKSLWGIWPLCAYVCMCDVCVWPDCCYCSLSLTPTPNAFVRYVCVRGFHYWFGQTALEDHPVHKAFLFFFLKEFVVVAIVDSCVQCVPYYFCTVGKYISTQDSIRVYSVYTL